MTTHPGEPKPEPEPEPRPWANLNPSRGRGNLDCVCRRVITDPVDMEVKRIMPGISLSAKWRGLCYAPATGLGQVIAKY